VAAMLPEQETEHIQRQGSAMYVYGDQVKRHSKAK